MARTAGIPLIDLFAVTDQVNSVLPDNIRNFTDRFVATQHRTTRSAGAIQHHGVLQSVLDSASAGVEELDLVVGTLQIPLVNAGLPFQLSIARAPIAGNLEPAPTSWQLDLHLDEVVLVLNFLEPAIYVPEAGTMPRHLLRDPGREKVKIIGGATVRLSKVGNADIVMSFIHESDPLDPTAVSGGVASLTCSPPHFFFGKSQFGMTIDQLEWDFSDSYSPPAVIERGQSAGWTGVSIKEATIYAPRNLPLVGDMSGSVRNALFGYGGTGGIQGDFELQFGRTSLHAGTFRFRQEGHDEIAPEPIADPNSPRTRKVAIVADQDMEVTVQAALAASEPPDGGTLEDWSANWVWPRGPDTEDEDVSSGTVRHGDELKVTPLEHVEGQDRPIAHPEIIFRFEAAGEGAVVNIDLDGTLYENVVAIGGTIADIGALTLRATSTAPGDSTFTWEVPKKNTRHKGETFQPDVTGLSGTVLVKLSEKPDDGDPKRVSHLQIRIVDEGNLLIGTENGVFDATDNPTVPQELSDVEATYDLSDFHGKGETNTKAEQATLDDSISANVSVPDDGLAQVVVPLGTETTVDQPDRHIRVLMEFDDNVVLGWGSKDDDDVLLAPAGANGGGSEATIRPQVQDWAARYPDASFIVVGRCDDIDTNTYNKGLADKRAEKGRQLLTGPDPTSTAVDVSRVAWRGEQSTWHGDSGPNGDELQDDVEPPMDPAETTAAVNNGNLSDGRLILEQQDADDWPDERVESDPIELIRVQYRRVDIYAVEGTPEDGSGRGDKEVARDPTLRRSLVPANDRTLVPTHAPDPRFDYRVRLLLGWDKPTAQGFDKAVPNLGELDIAWTPSETPLPDLDNPKGGKIPVDVSAETLTIEVRFVHDEITDFTRITVGVRSEGDDDGLASAESSFFTATLALAPMLLSGVHPEDDAVGAGARLTALVALAGISQIDVGGGKKVVGDSSKTALVGVRGEVEMRSSADPGAAYQLKLLAEYTCTLHVNFGALGLRTRDGKPMKVRYKDVGLSFDNTKEGWEKLGLAYDTRSLEIEDPGVWEISGLLGELLRVVEVEMGNGSLWIEARLAIGINLGIIEVTEAIVRMTFDDDDQLPAFELRGFVLTADIPGVLTGEGRLRIEDNGTVRAGVEARVIPVGLGCTAGLALGKPFGNPPGSLPDIFMELFLGVQFATPVPLGPSGAALYGFKGLFVMNGERDIDPDPPDRVKAELDWWDKDAGGKYRPELGQYALGVGVVVGTMPDASFCFSASGMLVVAFPDPEVILGVDVQLISVPDTQASEGRKKSSDITGLIVIDDEAVTVAVSATYEIPGLLKLKVPFGAYFPYSLEGTYVRIGTDDQPGRRGEPITLTLLPGTLDARAWAYLMIEQDGLANLGGDPRFSFDGFSVGMGVGWDIEWSAGPIELRASAKVLVGFGTNPLLVKGGVFVDGELDLVVVSIGARGELILTYLEEQVYLEGEFCGSVDMFFFSLEGCVGVDIGSKIEAGDPPAPPGPVVSVDLTDRQDRIMGAATTGNTIAAVPIFDLVENEDGITTNEGAPPGENHTVWADTAPVLNFRQHPDIDIPSSDRIAPGSSGGPSIFSGSNRLKYAYRINRITLVKADGGDVGDPAEAIQTVWMSSPVKLPDSSGLDNPASSEHEGPRLKLLDWDPWTWVENTESGGEGTGGDPAEEIEDLCDPLPLPRRACVYGRAARGASIHKVRFRADTPALPPYPSKFFLTAEAAVTLGSRRYAGAALHSLIVSTGALVLPGAVVDLPFPVSLSGEVLKRGYRLPSGRLARPEGLRTTPMPWEGTFDREVTEPELTFLVCEAAGQAGDTLVDCFDFDGVRPDGQHLNLILDGLTIRALDRQQPFTTTDEINSIAEPARRGQDGRADIRFPESGIEVFLTQPSVQAELYFWKGTGAPIQIEAIDTTGAVADTASLAAPTDRQVRARLTGINGIVRIRITGGGNESYFFRICCTTTQDVPPPPPCETFRGVKVRDDGVQTLTHNGFLLSTLRRSDVIRMTDRVDQRGAEPVRGRDGKPEFLFPNAGMSVRMPAGCLHVELWVMLGGTEVVATGLDERGRTVARARTPAIQGVPLMLSLRSSGDPIRSVRLVGGAGEASFFRICCREATGGERCIDFKGFRLPDGVSSFTHRGIDYSDLGESNGLRLVDKVNVGLAEPAPGTDGVGELVIPKRGLGIKFESPADTVVIRAMTFASGLKGESRNAMGARTDGTSTSAERGVEHVLRFAGPDIASIELFGGDGDAVIYEICVTTGPAQPDQPGDGGNGRQLPVVLGKPGLDERGDRWPSRIISSHELADGRRCMVVAYTPGDQARAYSSFDLLSPDGWEVTFLSACAVDLVAVQNHAVDETNRIERLDLLTELAGLGVEERRDLILEADTTYEIHIDWSWYAWEANEDGTDTPPQSVDDADWKTDEPPQVFRFATAGDTQATGTPQDGLNEHVFDARDMARYINRIEPVDGRAVHFTDDPVWVHFSEGHVDQLAEIYGYELEIEVRRTDPPPQETPAGLEALLAPLEGTLTWHTGPASLNSTGANRVNEAILVAPCLPDEPVAGGASMAGHFELEPEAMYDLNLVARAGNARILISGTRFTTSRYADPEAMLADLGYDATTDSPFPADEIVRDGPAPDLSGGMEVSDAALGELLASLDADTLPLPTDTPKSYVFWRFDGVDWVIDGVLIDALEPMTRDSAVVSGTGTEIVERVTLAGGRVGTTDLDVYRANTNWTRVFLAPVSPVVPASDARLEITLATPEGDVTGGRILDPLPRMLELEGLV